MSGEPHIYFYQFYYYYYYLIVIFISYCLESRYYRGTVHALQRGLPTLGRAILPPVDLTFGVTASTCLSIDLFFRSLVKTWACH